MSSLPRRSRSGLALCVLGLLSCAPGEEPPRPSVVLIVVDTLRADRLGCYGYPGDVSPALDALAAGGARFARAVSQAPWTRPSIGSLLTSVHPRSLGLEKQVGDVLPQDVDTLAEVFQRFGYTTVGATANPNINAAYEFDQGFDEHLDSNMLWRWMQRVEGAEEVARDKVQAAEDVFGFVLDVVDRTSGPYYLQVDVMEVHEFLPGDFPAGKVPTERLDALYAAAVGRASEAVGAFLDALATRPGFEDRIVVVTSDHGEGLHDHPGVLYAEHHGSVLYESQLLVPLIVADTGGRVPEGLVVERPVRLLDVAPTILDLVGLPPLSQAEGTSLRPLFEGGDVALPDAFGVETFFAGKEKAGLWTAEWLYVEGRDGHEGTDPVELQAQGSAQDGARTNQAHERPDEVRRLEAALAEWSARHPARTPTARSRPLSEDHFEQLRAIGYTGDE